VEVAPRRLERSLSLLAGQSAGEEVYRALEADVLPVEEGNGVIKVGAQHVR